MATVHRNRLKREGYSIGNEKVTARDLQSRHCNFKIVDVTLDSAAAVVIEV